ncbi:MAG: EVE domain-containing protein [Anaerolineales bacterium]
MNTYLLAFNPKRWRWTDLPELSAHVKSGAVVLDRWGTGTSRRLKKGDRFFLIQLGEEPKGIFASGYIETDSYQDLHWMEEKSLLGEQANYVQIRYDVLLNPETDPILPREILNHPPLSQMHWNIRMSGVQIPEAVAGELEILWKTAIKNFSKQNK